MTHLTSETSITDHLDGNPPAQKLAWAMAIARHARDDRWTADDVAQTLQMLGLDTLPAVHRALARHGYDTPVGTNAPPLAAVDNLVAAVLTVSLADSGDRSVLTVLETTEDSTERADLLTRDGVTPAMASAYAGLDATLVRLALTDADAALDGIAARARQPFPGPGSSGSPGEAA